MQHSKKLLLMDELRLNSSDLDEQQPISLQKVLRRKTIKGVEMYKM